jgi:3-hydroxyisobutyrate dehydrogenase
MVAAGEALALGMASGLDAGTLLEAISGGAAGSWTLTNLAPRAIAGDWAPGFRTALLEKDLRLVLESACGLKLPLTGAALTHQLCLAAEADGMGDEGTQSLFKIIKSLGPK